MKQDMRKYILRKLIELIFTLLFVTLLSFLLMRLSSVDPATAYAKRMIGNPTAEQIEKIRIQLGFDKPLLVQYGRWVWDLLHFDLGVSLANGHDVWTDIATAFPKTLGIVALASIFQVVFIVIVSCIAFLLPWKLPKKAVRLLCILGVSIPSFYLATVYLDYFAVQKSLISVAGNTTLLSYISMEIPAGRVIGLTGKSGSGKTTLLRSILGMLHTSCHIDAGKILLDDIDLSHLSRKSHRELCGKKLGFIPQNPMTAFDSRLKIGYQMRETFVNRLHLNTSEATDLAKEKLVSVNLKDTDRILGAYPSELSGGMLQRVAAAILLGMSPDYVLADEPTAALDEENRDLLLLIMQEQMKDKGILFVSHDVAALKNLCQNVYVLGAGKIIEHGTMDKLLSSPQTDWMKKFSALSHRESRGEWKWEKL